MHQAESFSMVLHHITGEDNVMANVISCTFKDDSFFEISHDLVSYFNTNFPLVQNK